MVWTTSLWRRYPACYTLPMKQYLTSQIDSRRARLQILDQERLKVLAEIGAYEDMLAHLRDSERAMPTKPTEAATDPRGITEAVNQLSPAWRAILAALVHRTNFNTSRVLMVAKQQGVATTEVNVRSQLSIYTNRGILDRIGTGLYCLTPLAADALSRLAMAEGNNEKAADEESVGDASAALSNNPEHDREAGRGGGT